MHQLSRRLRDHPSIDYSLTPRDLTWAERLCGSSQYNKVMSRQLEAVYEHGVLRPLEPLSLAEHQRVRLTLDEKPARLSWESSEPVNERREELQWLAKEAGPYAGEWVVLHGSRLVAHGLKLADVSATAAAAGIDEPFFARVPKVTGVPFGGW